TLQSEPAFDTFTEVVQQTWYLWRKYDLFLRCVGTQSFPYFSSAHLYIPLQPLHPHTPHNRSTPHRAITLVSDSQPLPASFDVHFTQFVCVHEDLWIWDFVLKDAQGKGIASVSRAFRGIGRRWADESWFFPPYRSMQISNPIVKS
ncbi:hypothetical protein BDN67DRAFT_913040, partial [Paxillus ammoniavirescens]